MTDAGRYVVAQMDGRAMPVPIEEYKARLTARLVAEVKTLRDFRTRWIEPPSRQELLDALVSAGYSPSLVRLVVMGDGRVVVPVDCTMRSPDPIGPGAPCSWRVNSPMSLPWPMDNRLQGLT